MIVYFMFDNDNHYLGSTIDQNQAVCADYLLQREFYTVSELLKFAMDKEDVYEITSEELATMLVLFDDFAKLDREFNEHILHLTKRINKLEAVNRDLKDDLQDKQLTK